MELTEAEFGEVTAQDWACENFLQSVEMYRRYKELNREAYLVGVVLPVSHKGLKKAEKRRILAAGLVSARPWRMGKKIFQVAGGWLMNYDEEAEIIDGKIWAREEILGFLTEKMREFCRKRGGIVLEISPNVEARPRDRKNNILPGKDHLAVQAELERMGYKYLGEVGQVKWQYVLELAGETAEGLFRDFRTDHRQRIRRAEREEVRVRELAMDELPILKQIAAEAGERHGFQDPQMAYYRSVKKHFGEKVKFLVAELAAEKEGGKPGEYIPLAAAMFVNDGREMIYLYSGSVRKYQKYGGAHLIQWKMIQEALASGCKRYNFYGVRPVEGDGVYNFKQGFRGHVEELLGTFALPIGLLGKLYLLRQKPREYGEVH